MRNTQKYLLILSLLLLVFVLPVRAQEISGEVSGSVPAEETVSSNEQTAETSVVSPTDQSPAGSIRREIMPEVRQNIREQRQETRQGAQELRQEARPGTPQERQDTRQNIQEQRQETRQEVRQERQEARQEVRQERRAEAQQKIQEVRENIKQRRQEIKEKVIEKREQVKERLQTIKDQRKQKIAERLYEQMNNLNIKVAERLFLIVDKLEAVLGRVETRTEKAGQNGGDVSAVRTAIEGAQNAISASRAAIETQAQKVYTFEVNTEETLKNDIGVARQALRDDLQQVRQTIVTAREAVKKAAVALAQIPRVNEYETPAPAPEASEPAPAGE